MRTIWSIHFGKQMLSEIFDLAMQANTWDNMSHNHYFCDEYN